MDNIVVAQRNTSHSALRTFFESNVWGLFAFSCVIYLTSLYAQQQLVLTDAVFYRTLSEQFTLDRIQRILEQQKRWQWLSYLLVPVVLAVKALLITVCLNIGAMLLDYKVALRKLFMLVVRALCVLAIGKAVYTVILLSVEVNFAEDMLKADWFSLSALLGYGSLPSWLQYPLSLVNLFELLFWLALATGIHYLLNLPFRRAFTFVAGTYGVGLLFFAMLVVFLQISLG